MLKKPSLLNKKGDIELSLIHLLEIILAIGVIMLLVYLSLELSGIFLSRQEYDSTINNLEALSIRINELIKDTNNIKTLTTVYSIPDNFILVGFNYNNNDIIRTECTQEDIINSRPKTCQSNSCMCIYKNYGGVTDWSGKDFDSKGFVAPLKCKPFDEKIIFLAPKSDSPNPNFRGSESKWKPTYYTSTSNYNNLVLYGICGGPWRTSWGVRQVYVEKNKEKEGENTYIFIGDMSDKKIVERSNYFKGNS